MSAPAATVAAVGGQHIVYGPADRPDVEVLYEGTWCPGEVRMVKWVDGVELHEVQYRRPGELSSHIDEFSGDQIRADMIDRGRSSTAG